MRLRRRDKTTPLDDKQMRLLRDMQALARRHGLSTVDVNTGTLMYGGRDYSYVDGLGWTQGEPYARGGEKTVIYHPDLPEPERR